MFKVIFGGVSRVKESLGEEHLDLVKECNQRGEDALWVRLIGSVLDHCQDPRNSKKYPPNIWIL
jgi:hypothetical protein